MGFADTTQRPFETRRLVLWPALASVFALFASLTSGIDIKDLPPLDPYEAFGYDMTMLADERIEDLVFTVYQKFAETNEGLPKALELAFENGRECLRDALNNVESVTFYQSILAFRAAINCMHLTGNIEDPDTPIDPRCEQPALEVKKRDIKTVDKIVKECGLDPHNKIAQMAKFLPADGHASREAQVITWSQEM